MRVCECMRIHNRVHYKHATNINLKLFNNVYISE